VLGNQIDITVRAVHCGYVRLADTGSEDFNTPIGIGGGVLAKGGVSGELYRLMPQSALAPGVCRDWPAEAGEDRLRRQAAGSIRPPYVFSGHPCSGIKSTGWNQVYRSSCSGRVKRSLLSWKARDCPGAYRWRLCQTWVFPVTNRLREQSRVGQTSAGGIGEGQLRGGCLL